MGVACNFNEIFIYLLIDKIGFYLLSNYDLLTYLIKMYF